MKIKLKNTYLSFKNTNPLVGGHQKFLVSKTGYIRAAGGCIALLMETDKGKRAVIYRDWETDRRSTRLNSSHRL